MYRQHWTATARRNWIPRDAASVVCVADYDPVNLSAGAVAAWPDSSGKAHPLAQATGTKQPIMAVDSTLSNYPTVIFDGADDYMDATFTLVQPYSVLLVWKNVTLGLTGVHDVCFDGKTGVDAFLTDTAQSVMFCGAAMTNLRKEADGVFNYASIIVNGASSIIRTTGVQRSATNAGGNNPGGVTLGALSGGTRSTNIAVGRMIMFSGALAGAELLAAESYLKTKYRL